MPSNLTPAEATRLLDLSLLDGDLLALTTTAPTDASAGTEVTGGSYARQSLAFDDAASGQKTLTTTVVFNDMPAASLIGWNIYDSTGSDRKWWGLFNSHSAVSVSSTLTVPSNPFADGDSIVFQSGFSPSGVVAGTTYYVVNTDGNDFQVSDTFEGDPLTIGDSAVIIIGSVYDIDAGNNFGIPAGSSTVSFSLT